MGVGIGILVLLILGFSWRQMDAVSCTSTSYQDTIPTCWGCTCDKAFDGNSHSRWASAWDDNQSITLDFGKLVTIDHVVLKWEMAYGKAYTIDASSDGIRWTSVYTETQGDGGVDDVHFPLTMTRYVRMQGLGRGLELGGYSLWEFEAYQGNDISLLKYFQRIPKVCHPKDPSK
jgi:hypothetical protein